MKDTLKLPLDVLFNEKLTGNDIRVYGIFVSLIIKNISDEVEVYKIDKDEYVVKAKKDTLLDICKVSSPTFAKAVKNLEENGFVKTLHNKGSRYLEYVVIFDDSINPSERPVSRKKNDVVSHAKEKLEKHYVLSDQDKQIIELAKYYDVHVREYLKYTGYRSLPVKTDPRKSKRWKHFAKVYAICSEKGWDYKAYIDAQFERAKNWTNKKFKYPLPSMLYSESAQKYYMDFEANRRKKTGYAADDNYVKFKPKHEVEPLQKKIVKEVKEGVETMKFYLTTGYNPEVKDAFQIKMMQLIEKWENYPSAYLYHVTWVWSWYREYLEGIAENNHTAKRIIEDFKRFDNNKRLQETIHMAVNKFEKAHGIIPTPTDEEIDKYAERRKYEERIKEKVKQDIKEMQLRARKKFTSAEEGSVFKKRYPTWNVLWEDVTNRYISDLVKSGATDCFITYVKRLFREYGMILLNVA